MSRILAGTAIALIFVANARAADISSYSPAPVASWQGFHAGILGSFARFDAEVDDTNLDQFDGEHFSHELDGGLFGIMIGHDWQFGRAIVGLEADLSASTLRELDYEGTSDDGIFTSLGAFGTVRARLGYAASDQFLIYGTGGLAFGHITQIAGDLECQPSDSSCGDSRIGFGDDNSAHNLGDWRVGWTLGVGAEYRFSPSWSLRGEYLYADLGSYTALVPDGSETGLDLDGRFDNRMHMGRIALSHRFAGERSASAQQVALNSPWSGTYAGMTGGFAKLDSEVDDRNLFQFGADSFSADIDGGLAGLLIGYNWQNGSFVFGVEADLSATFLDGLTYDGASDDGVYSNLDALTTVRGRFGVAPSENVLLYGTAGIALAHVTQLAGDVECTSEDLGCPSDQIGFDDDNSAWSLGEWKAGWTAGAGVDVKLGQGWVVRGEYLYVDLGTYTALVPDDEDESAGFDNTMHIGRAGLIRRF